MSTTLAAPARIRIWVELTKPRIAILLEIVALLAYLLAAGEGADLRGVAVTLVSVGLLAAGVFSLNHYVERDRDRLAVRTRSRPIPSGGVTPRQALVFGTSTLAASFVFAAVAANLLTAAIGVFVAVSYLGLYTPLKYRTVYHTALGALSGATPPLMGWAIATGGVGWDGWILAALMFFWQFPHFLSIEMMYREDYRKAGVKVLPEGRRGTLVLVTTHLLLIAVSILPVVTGLAGWVYGALALALGAGFLVVGARVVAGRARLPARHLLRASVIYLPLVLLFLVVGF